MDAKKTLVRAAKVVLFPVTLIAILARMRRRRALRWSGPDRPRPPDAGVREPRKPKPLAGAGAAALPEPDD